MVIAILFLTFGLIVTGFLLYKFYEANETTFKQAAKL